MKNDTFTMHGSSLVPIYRWRGARPYLLDLDGYQVGWTIILVLTREGDCCLLPVAWQREHPDLDEERLPLPVHFYTDAVDRESFDLTLADLERDGWQISGRLDVHFTGCQADPDFWQNVRAYLWQTPG
jgi:hypothetical protein